MDTLIGTTLSHYSIVEKIGAGGMGEVYRARDTRLGRDVAIKVIPAELTATAEARARFEREARAVSHLNHPNICTLHDIGREGETDFLVMELISGGSLRDRLTRKPLPLDQVLTLGIEIADALEAAHARGIVHGDLTPGNVLLTEQGQAKVMNFSMAAPGQIVGTVAYMSPEQARGEEVDARSDVFSLGSVLYEMASGHRAFEGSSTAVIFEAILNRTPAPVSMLRQGVPAELDRIIGKALEKDRELRYQTAGEVRSDLKRLKRDLDSSRAAGSGAAGDSGSRARTGMADTLPASVIARRRISRVAWGAAAVLVLAGAILLVTNLARREPPREAARLSLEAPAWLYRMGTPRISPDGHNIAFTAQDSAGVTQIWIRPMDGPASWPLPGTEGASWPFWSPDSRFIGFTSRKKLKKIAAAGGQPVMICESPSAASGSWGLSGTILLDTDGFGLQAVSSAGGQPFQAAWPDRSRGELYTVWPEFLPDGRHFLYLGTIKDRPDSTALRVGCLGSKESKILAIGEFSRVEYVTPGYVLYLRGRTLLAQSFDAKRLQMTGDAFPVLDDVLRAGLYGEAEFSASATGALVYRDEVALLRQQLVWLDRTGRKIGTLGPAGRYFFGMALSPDEKRVAISFAPPGETTPDIWIVDVVRDVAIRLTSDPGLEIWPIWSPDGATIFFESMPGGSGRVWMKPASGIGEARELSMPPGDVVPQAVTPDGRFLLAIFKPPDSGPKLVKVSLDANPRTTPLGFMGTDPSLSRDGKWLAYASAETGRNEVYVVDFPGLTGKWRVSVDSGWGPRWSADGKELFFVNPHWQLMSAPVSTVSGFQVGRPVRVLEKAGDLAWCVPTSGGKRFLAKWEVWERQGLPDTKVVLNWQAAVRRR